MPKFDKKAQENFSLSKQRAMQENAEIDRLVAAYTSFDPKTCASFADLPLSAKTLRGLNEASFRVPTNIQKESIPLALKGCDILGAAKTGSGKTLAFVIPTLEKLFTKSWSHFDGCGVLIVTPTRELATQIFEVLRTVGKFHSFSAGVVIGGKSLKQESEQIRTTNIIICTPGRLKQHMEETYNFDLTNLQLMVLDEADRMLDMGFKRDMDIILENLPQERQTLLFSATQTKSLNDLARLSLQNPVFVSAHELSEYSTPDDLRQNYIVCELFDKLNILFSFIKTHLQQKTLVFVSTCKQVKFLFAAFCKFRPGTSVMALHGDLSQMKRIGVFEDFCRKQRGILIATDVAARGLDFPGINWVVQVDCPDSAESYIHRVGRTARFEKGGQALLFLLPSEKAMLQALEKRRVPITGIKTNPKQVWSIDGKLQSLCASDLSMKERAQRAFVAYMRSVFLMSDKTIFNPEALDLERFAKSLGLAAAPKITFSKSNKNDEKAKKEKQADDSSEQLGKKLVNFDVDDGKDEDDLLIPVGKVEAVSDEEELPAPSRKPKVVSKFSQAKRALGKKIQSNKRIVFPENGGEEDLLKTGSSTEEPVTSEGAEGDGSSGAVFSFDKALKRLSKADAVDKVEWRERVKGEHRRKRLAGRQQKRESKTPNSGVTLGGTDKDGAEDGENSSSEGSSYSDNGQDEAEGVQESSDGEDNEGEGEVYFSGDDDEDQEDSNPGSAKRRCVVSSDAENLALKLLSGK